MEYTSVSPEEIGRLVADKLVALLEEGPVAWFVSGGSNIGYQTETIRILAEETNVSGLTILLVDERFGAVGHLDSNWAQLEEKGFMIPGPTYIAPFTEEESTLEQAVKRYETVIRDTLASGYTFAQLGMGADGHVSGILPGSEAAFVRDALVAGYVRPPYQRLTTTFPALRMLDEVVLVALGDDKSLQLQRLEQDIDQAEHPVQILKEIPRVTIYTN